MRKGVHLVGLSNVQEKLLLLKSVLLIEKNELLYVAACELQTCTVQDS